MPNTSRAPEREALDTERRELLARISNGLETPMIVLGFAWLVLVVLELTSGLPPFLEQSGYVIWALFVIHFLLEFALAPEKTAYLKRNWLTLVALIAPALRVLAAFRVLRVVRAAPGLRLLRVVSSVNRGMRSLGHVMRRNGFGYVLSLTILVVMAGAAGMYAFERDVPGTAVADVGSAVWWTAMTVTTMGSDYFPRTSEGRLLCLILAIYGFAIFGYVTATIASLFVVREAESGGSVRLTPQQLEELRYELGALRRELGRLASRPDQSA
jgi:voltage-gated potassium channel